MNTKDFLRMGIPLGQATRRATDFVSRSAAYSHHIDEAQLFSATRELRRLFQ
jgi:hypothetical protein